MLQVDGVSSIIEGGFIYSWGHQGSHVILARVPTRKPWDRPAYSFWNSREWVKDWTEATAVLGDVQHGAVMKSGLFGPRREWVFVGSRKGAEGEMMMGAAASLEGPWELTRVCTVGGVDCVYPHQWVYDEQQGDLMVSWREPQPGGVVAGKLSLEMGK